MISMSTNKSKVTICLKKSEIEFQFIRHTDTLKIPPVLFNHLKVVDAHGLERLIVEFIAKHYPKKIYRAVIVINPEINFEKNVVDLNIKEYAHLVTQAVGKFKWIDPSFRQWIKPQFVIGFMFIILLIALVAVLKISGGFLKPSQPRIVASPVQITFSEALPKPSFTASPSATPSDLNLSNYTMRILNASDVPNQAGKLKSELLKVGFSVITTANQASNQINTTVVYSSGVPQSVRQLIKDQLSKDFNKIVTLDDDPNPKFDITITIGQG